MNHWFIFKSYLCFDVACLKIKKYPGLKWKICTINELEINNGTNFNQMNTIKNMYLKMNFKFYHIQTDLQIIRFEYTLKEFSNKGSNKV